MLANGDDLEPAIDDWIAEVLPRSVDAQYVTDAFAEARFEHDWVAVQGGLVDPAWDLLDRGGKRWRPRLFVTLVEGLGGNPERYRPYACVPELLHTGSLIVDDVEDGATLRRGEAALHRLYGQDVALNLGNVLYFLPLRILSRNPAELSSEGQLRVYDTVVEELTSMHLGQTVDIYWHNETEIRMDERQYLEMCACKTGSLVRLLARLAAIVVAESREVEQSLAAWAESLSVAFQIGDDVLDVESTIGEVDGFGKVEGNDIREGKKTLMVIHAANNAPPEDVARLEEILAADEIGQAEIEAFVDVLRSAGSVEYARERAHDFRRSALDHLERVDLEEEAAQKLADLTTYAVERDA